MSIFGRFPSFLSKTRCSTQRIFSMKPYKWPLSIFLSIGANLKIIEKKSWSVRHKKLKADSTRKKFFWLFHAKTTWKCFSRRKRFFLKKFYLGIFGHFSGEDQSGAVAQLWSLNTKKFRLIFLFIILKNLGCQHN